MSKQSSEGMIHSAVLPPYPAYRPSGIDWLGDIPAHWELKRIKYIASQPKVRLERKPDHLPYLGLENIESHTGRLLLDTPIESAESTVAVFHPGDVLFGKLRPYLAKAALADFAGVGTTELLVLQPTAECHARYLLYLLLSEGFIDVVAAQTYGTKMPRADGEQIATMYACFPPLSEQRAIADYLDRATARIDALVAAQERLLELLVEKRRALISHAVTKGLDPSAPMQDSGIEWLGEIPAHWEVRRLKFLTSFVTSGSRGWAEHYTDNGALFLRIGNLSRDSIDFDLNDIQHVTPPKTSEVERTRVQSGDLLISITAYIGAVGVAPNSIEEAYVNQHIALTRPRQETLMSRWAAYFLLSWVGQSQFMALLNGGTKDGLGLDDVQNLTLILPPQSEQLNLLSHIDRETARLDTLAAKVRAVIERLGEYRAALISAAVTGKVDVRGAQADHGGGHGSSEVDPGGQMT